MDRWYFARQKQKIGPVSSVQLQQLAASGQLRPSDMVLKEGAQKWTMATSIPDLFPNGERRTSPVGCAYSLIARAHQPGVLPIISPRPYGSGRPRKFGGLWMWVGGAGAVSVVAVAVVICLFNSRKEDRATPGRSENGNRVAASTPSAKPPVRVPEKVRKPVNKQDARKETAKSTDKEPRQTPKEEAQAEEERVKAAVKQEVEARRQERQKRLTTLALREQNEIPPLENEVIKFQRQIANLDNNLATLRAQQQSLPRSFGIPTGTRFRPAISRDVRDVAMQGRQNWEAQQRQFRHVRAELVEKLREAQDRLEEKRQELAKEGRQLLLDL